jgi:hypothetical protein
MSQQKPPSAVAWGRLLDDAAGIPAAESRRNKYIALARILSDAGADKAVSWRTVEKWFERNSMPGVWLVRIAAALAALGRPIDLAVYASD